MLTPGLYKATVRGVPDQIILLRNDEWASTPKVVNGNFLHRDGLDFTDARPLIVLDLAGRHDPVGGLRAVANAARHVCEWDVVDFIADQIEAQTKPPRIPEPGLWGVVEASYPVATIIGDLDEWVHRIDGWHCPNHGRVAWDRLVDPVLIRDGIEATS